MMDTNGHDGDETARRLEAGQLVSFTRGQLAELLPDIRDLVEGYPEHTLFLASPEGGLETMLESLKKFLVEVHLNPSLLEVYLAN